MTCGGADGADPSSTVAWAQVATVREPLANRLAGVVILDLLVVLLAEVGSLGGVVVGGDGSHDVAPSECDECSAPAVDAVVAGVGAVAGARGRRAPRAQQVYGGRLLGLLGAQL